jgi:hypothetical protein
LTTTLKEFTEIYQEITDFVSFHLQGDVDLCDHNLSAKSHKKKFGDYYNA